MLASSSFGFLCALRRRATRVARCLMLAAVACGLLLSSHAAAADLRDQAEALNGVPADAAFYATWLKNRQQIEAVQQTNAWRRLKSIPLVQMGWMQVQTQWQFPTDERVQAVKAWIESEEGQELLALGAEMASEEVFIYGDGAMTQLLQLAMELNSISTRNQGFGIRAVVEDDESDQQEDAVEQQVLKDLLEHLEDNQERITAPGFVIGFRIEDEQRAADLLDRAEQALRQLAEQCPVPIDDDLSRQQVDGYDLLTLTLTADMLPWDEIAWELEESPEVLASLKRILAGKQAVLAVGLVENFVVVSFGDSIDQFENIGDGPLLVDTKELKRLAQHAGEQITTIGYVSEAFLQAASSNERQFRDLADNAKELLPLSKLDAEQQAVIARDVDATVDDLLAYLPEPGAVAAVSFLTDRGFESYSYNWGELSANLDASQPLPLISHLGDDSLGWLIARSKQSIEEYNKFVDWCKRWFTHGETIAKQLVFDEENGEWEANWAKYEEARDTVLPILQQLDAANRECLLPGMADGQGAVVLSAAAADDAWCEFMPAADAQLPLPTLALVYGVSDAGLVKEAASEYTAVIQQVIDIAHEKNPDEVPPLKIPPPEKSVLASGTLYAYELPGEWGASERVAPNAVLSDSVLVLSVLPELGERLAAGSQPLVDGPAAEFDRPLVAASHFKFAKFLQTLDPWIDYGIKAAIANASEEEGAGAVAMIGMVKPQLDQLLEVLQTMHAYTGVTYREEDAWVTHAEMRLIDLEE